MVFLRSLTSICALTALAGCIPMVAPYYKAESANGKDVGAPTGRPDRAQLFTFDDVSLSVFPWEGAIGLELRVPDGSTVEIESNEIVITAVSSADSDHVTFDTILSTGPTRPDDLSLPWDAPLVGTTQRWFGMLKAPITYTIVITPPQELAEGFTVALPAIRVNGQRFQVPPVTFARSRRFWIQPVK